ncbi:DnaJ domain-containing protein [Cryptosporidium canis]|uniref:DnaJ domain-containing protein n=1 Tax=Cryptosporidium canis TaxID=195482 RepID=A0A9D5DLB9_9CRYT|nr:DnaJ domain-containing protein [Cryptosporidium canis]
MPESSRIEKIKTHYDALELNKDCSKEDICRAYLRLALEWHPDGNKADTEVRKVMFKKISNAYKVLSNDELRRKYDSSIDELMKQNSSEGTQSSGLDPYEIFEKFMAEVLADKDKCCQYSSPSNGEFCIHSNSNSDSNSDVDFRFDGGEKDANINDDLFTEDEDIEYCDDCPFQSSL